MEFIELYNLIILLWPEKIDISDGYPTGQDGFMFPIPSKIHHHIEGTIDQEKDRWAIIGVWACFQAFHECARKLKDMEEGTLKTRAVSKTNIDERIRSTLSPLPA